MSTFEEKVLVKQKERFRSLPLNYLKHPNAIWLELIFRLHYNIWVLLENPGDPVLLKHSS